MSGTRQPERMDRRTFVGRSSLALGGTAGLLGLPATEPASAAARSQTSAGSEGAKVVRMNTTTNVGNHFNPLWFIGTGSQWHSFPFIWVPLVFYNPQGQMEPWLAEAIDVSPDATVYTFTLHQNAVWSDGQPVTADDVKFSYELMANPATKALGNPQAFSLTSIAGMSAYLNDEAESVEGIQVVDPKTVRFTLEHSNSLFLQDAWIFVMPKHVLGETAIEDLPSNPYVDNPTVTSGPFRLARYEPRQFIELEAWTDYWGPTKPKVDRVVLVQAEGPAVMNMLESGELDVGVYLSMDEAERLTDVPGVEPVIQLTSGEQNIYVNGRREYLQDHRVRQAIAYAIDRGPLNDLLHQGMARPIYSEIIGPEWAVSPNLTEYSYDPERARQLLEEAGWDFGRTLVFWTNNTSGPAELGLYLQASLQSIGVQMEIETSPFSAVADAYNSDTFDLSELGGGQQAVDPHFALQTTECGGLWSGWLNYCNPEVDELLHAGIATTDQEERQAIYWEAGEILNRDQPFVYLFQPPTGYAVSTRLTGFQAPNWYRYANTSLLDWDVAE